MKTKARWVGVGSVCMAAAVAGGCNWYPAAGGPDGRAIPSLPDAGGFVISVAEDQRPVVTAPTIPPPISGGTLLVTHDGLTAVAADPDRDRVLIVDLASGTVTHTVTLTPGDEPGRVVEDGAGRVHVALRRGGALVTIDIASGAVLSRRAVCGAPRGVAYDPVLDQVHVACSGGELVTFAASGGDAVRRLNLGVDLRDVVVQAGRLVVSRFKTAELLLVDASGNVTSSVAPHAIQRIPGFTVLSGPMLNDGGTPPGALLGPVGSDPISPGGAWRTMGSPDGNVYVLHQYGFDGVIDLTTVDGTTPTPNNGVSFPPSLGSTSPYGAPPGGCGGLVQAGLSRLGTDGVFHMGMPLTLPPLTVDVSVSSDAAWVAFVSAGTRDPAAPVTPLGPAASGFGQVSIMPTGGPDVGGGAATGCTSPTSTFSPPGQTIAVAFNPCTSDAAKATGVWIVAQSREPPALFLIRDPMNSVPRAVDLGGPSMLDTGHELFHRDAGGGIACASCHLEGEEDGRVWQFDPIGPRRTQSVDVGLTGTEPFHWDGDQKDFPALLEEVMVRRMGGATQSTDRETAMQNWLFSLRPRAPMVDSNDPAAVRGAALFNSPAVGCFGCHSGTSLTNNQSLVVGTTDASHPIQVPSLHGVGYRAPFLHDGRAATLADRFDPAIGGGNAHGTTSQLAPAEISDLIAYLQSL